ncbi:MAG: ABC transporter ATP-binding protein [Candidatus Omnitrophota bacterium]|jgi:putative ABC transport system ATP-binding protein
MLEVKNIHKFYNNGKKILEVLKGVELNVESGRFIAIVGPSGAGKSTLLHILGGLDCPSQGKVIFEKEDIYALDDRAISHLRNKEIGFVFQFYNLLSEFTVLENVLMPAEIAGSVPHDAAWQLLDKMGLKDRAGHFPNQLSGGEKQRVAIARGLINNPRLLLCDEPTGNLDSKTGQEIISLIKKINLENSMTVIMVTHNIELTRQANAVYQLKDGILLS